MSTLAVDLKLPRDLLAVLDVPERQVGERLRQLAALELYREGRISSGKAAELAGMTKTEFVQLLATKGLLYFTEDPDELTAQLQVAESRLGDAKQ